MPNLAILFLANEDGETMSGGMRLAMESVAAWSLSLPGHVRVIAGQDAINLFRHFGYEAIACHALSVERKRSRFWFVATVARMANATRLLVEMTDTDVIFVESSFFSNLLPALGAKVLHRRIRLAAPVYHLIDPPWRRRGAIVRNAIAWVEQRCMVALLALFADVVVVDNQQLVIDLHRCGIDSSRCYVTSMGVADAAFRSIRENGCFQHDAVFVGRLCEPKGIPTLLEAWRSVVGSRATARLALVGTERPDLQLAQRIERLGLTENVKHYAGLDDDEVRAAISASRIFVTASVEEGYGISILEAFAQNKPAVTFDLPAFAEAFPFGREIARDVTAQALGDAILRLLEDEERYRRLQTEIVESKRIRSWKEVAADLYARLTTDFGELERHARHQHGSGQ